MIDLAPLKPQLNGKPIAVFGLGASGLAVFEAARAAGIETVLGDDNPALLAAGRRAGGRTADLSVADFTRFALLCLAPGVPLTHPHPHPVVAAALNAACDVVGDIELFHRAQTAARSIGITGTNGKSTVTALIGHLLRRAGLPCAVGGNIGAPVLTLPSLPDDGWYVLELSSFQLDLCHDYAPDIALLTNISVDHLDRHGGMEGYVAAKERIFRRHRTALISVDDAWSEDVCQRVQKQRGDAVIPVSCTRPLLRGLSVDAEGTLFRDGKPLAVLTGLPALRGRHNWQNAAFAAGAALAAGADADAVRAGLADFPGLAHRQHRVTVKNGVAYINDSKATNDQAAAVALAAYDSIYWIAGGRAKPGGWHACAPYLTHVRHAFLIGEAMEEMAAWLDGQGVPCTRSGTLDAALDAAHAQAQHEQREGATVLLAPACASYDQFRGFEHRGEVFAARVQELTA